LALQRPLGLISLLDEECMFPRATDFTLANKLKDHLKRNACFKVERDKKFRICHYAGEVNTFDHLLKICGLDIICVEYRFSLIVLVLYGVISSHMIFPRLVVAGVFAGDI
jgi:hypothetical protein